MMDYLLTNKWQVIMGLVVVNTLVALVNFILRLIKKDPQRGLMTSLFILICPLVAPMYLLLSWLTYSVFYKRAKDFLDAHELSFSKDKIRVILKPSLNEARNIVPLEEAFLVSDKESARQLLLDALKHDPHGSATAVLKAVGHKDSEVAHYAAASISEIIEDFIGDEKDLYQFYATAHEDKGFIKDYISYLLRYLDKRILPEDEQVFYIDRCLSLLDKLHDLDPSQIESEWYEGIVIHLLEVNKHDQADFYLKRAQRERPHDAIIYKAALRFYYTKGEYRRFKDLLTQLKQSDVVIDQSLLEIIRFYQ